MTTVYAKMQRRLFQILNNSRPASSVGPLSSEIGYFDIASKTIDLRRHLRNFLAVPCSFTDFSVVFISRR
jgi:hypothetical protein